MIAAFAGDVRYALRSLLRRPGFFLTAVLTLALGIGANTAIFSAVHRLVLRPMPYSGGERLVRVWQSMGNGGMMVAPPTVMADAWRERNSVLERLESLDATDLTLTGRGDPVVVRGARITAGVPSLLGLRPLVGHPLAAEDERPGGARLVLLGEGFWRTRFGARTDVVGQTIRLDGAPHTVAGVMPAALDDIMEMSEARDVWLPLVRDTSEYRSAVIARLRPGVTRERAQAELTRLGRAVPQRHPIPGPWDVRLMRPQDEGGTARRAMPVLFAAVGVVLLIACANVAGLLLARGAARQREIAVRAALGAGRGRLVGHFASEALVLALVGGAGGILLGAWGIDLIRAIRPEALYLLDRVQLSPVVLAFAAGLSLLTALIFGVVPAAAATRPDLTTALKSDAGAARLAGGRRLRFGFVMAEIALAVVLLVGAGLLIRTVMHLQGRDVGFDAAGLLSVELRPREQTAAGREAFYEQLLERVRRIPGVQSATVATGIPPGMGMIFGELVIEGRESPEAQQAMALPGTFVAPDFFRTLGVRLLDGRTFQPGTDRLDEVIVVNQAFAQKYWPGERAVGRRMRLGTSGPWRTVVGVAGNIATSGLAGPVDRPQVFTPIEHAIEGQTVLIRASDGDPLRLVPAVRMAVASLDRELPLRTVATVAERMRGTIAQNRFTMALLVAFAGLALTLAGVGLYGVISYAVTQRTREIGIRIALGAHPAAVRGLVVSQGLRVTAVGVAVGLGTALLLPRLLAGLLHGVPARDPLTFAAAALLVGATALLAAYLPARRATRVDPLVALRAE